MKGELNELALFAGSGGGILGGKLLGWRTRCAVEIDAYCRSVLLARQRDGYLERFPIWNDVRTFDGRRWRGVIDVVSGGFPCQDISAAGSGAGIEGSRSGLWKHMARILGEVQPRYVLVENSPVLTRRGLDVVLADLAALGFDAEWGVVGADSAGAPHRRKRIWIVAQSIGSGARDNSGEAGVQGRVAPHQGPEALRQGHREAVSSGADAAGEAMADADSPQCCPASIGIGTGEAHTIAGGSSGGERTGPEMADAASLLGDGCKNNARGGPEQMPKSGNGDEGAGPINGWWSTEPNVGRVADGVAARVDRLRAIGNGQVPAVVRLAWVTIGRRIEGVDEIAKGIET